MPWSDQFLSTRGIRSVCRKKICDEIFLPMKEENEWKVLIVDEFGMKILSSCFKTEEVIAFNIALIENIDKSREPLPYLSAVYFLYPSPQNIAFLQTDFVSSTPKYLDVHLFFLSTVSNELFKELLKYAYPGLVQTFKEVDFLFLPYESQVFSLNDERFFSIFFDAYKELDVSYCMFIAKKLASFCAALKVWPKIRYRRHFVKNYILAEAVQKELNYLHGNMLSYNSILCGKPRCELLILDRGFDCVSPVIHEFTFQAMAYDLLKIEDDVYVYVDDGQNVGEKRNEISLTEADFLWCRLRHEHISEVSKIIDSMFETSFLLRRHPKLSQLRKLPELGEAVRKHLAYRKHQPHSVYRRMANECMKLFCSGVNNIAAIERNLALGSISKSAFSKDVKDSVMKILSTNTFTIDEKLRVLLLYIFCSKGVTKQEFDDIITASGLPFSEARMITNVLHLDVDVFRPGFCKSVDYVSKQDSSTFQSLRWCPAIKNIMLSSIDDSLSHDNFPYVGINQRETLSSVRRSGYWCSDKKNDNASRLIVFVAGGITYSEMRSAYEVMTLHKGWEVYIGGDSLLTPQKFLNKLKELRCFISKDM